MEREKLFHVTHLLCESMGIRAISRVTGLCQQTVLNILKFTGRKSAQLLNQNIHSVNCEIVQADEIHSTVYSKQHNTHDLNQQRGDQFTFLAIDRKSKLIISHLSGKRTNTNATKFLTDLKSRMANTFQFTTDNWLTYSTIGGTVRKVFGEQINYATETKYFMKPGQFIPRQLSSIRRHCCIGSPDMDLATTAHVERTNLSMRHFNRRFTRCTISFSKKLEFHRHQVALFIWHFNFCRRHSAIKTTPAMAAGIIDRKLQIRDLFK